MGFSGENTGGLLCPSSGDLVSLALAGRFFTLVPPGKLLVILNNPIVGSVVLSLEELQGD